MTNKKMQTFHYDIKEIAKKIENRADISIKKFGSFNLVLSGGTSPLELYNYLIQQNYNFTKWQLLLADERIFTANESGILNTKDAVEPFQKKGATVIDILKDKLVINNWRIDLAILGVGEDGHVASLFPEFKKDQLELKESVLDIFNSPKFPPNRKTLSYEKISTASHILLLVKGQNKWHNLNSELDTPFNYFAKLENAEVFTDDNC